MSFYASCFRTTLANTKSRRPLCERQRWSQSRFRPFCEFAWVLSQGYKQAPSQIALAIEALLTIKTVRTDHAAVEAGLAMLGLGGDFADGVIDYEGRRLGGETYMTFDKKASKLVSASGRKVRLLVGAR